MPRKPYAQSRRRPVQERLPGSGFASWTEINRMSQALLCVAQENVSASRPPIRNVNITGEIAQMMRVQAQKEAIAQSLSMTEAP